MSFGGGVTWTLGSHTNTSLLHELPLCKALNSHTKCNTMGDAKAQASATSLTIWSSRRPQAPLAGALRTSCSGAAYRER